MLLLLQFIIVCCCLLCRCTALYVKCYLYQRNPACATHDCVCFCRYFLILCLKITLWKRKKENETDEIRSLSVYLSPCFHDGQRVEVFRLEVLGPKGQASIPFCSTTFVHSRHNTPYELLHSFELRMVFRGGTLVPQRL